MPTYKIAGIDVHFPFDAYDCQIVYMDRVISALQRGCNALLESPTGTGKTLCLLCATLAWSESLDLQDHKQLQNFGQMHSQSGLASQETMKSKLPTIIYASRTHSQLQQVIRELKSTPYRPKMAVLGSREQLCIHGDVKFLRGRAQNQACRSLCKARSCYHQTRVADYVKGHPELGGEPFDIEDLVSIGRTQGPCPFYLSRELHGSASIIFAPYNYLIEKENRRSLTGINWDNAVLIFDEAHNLESICSDAASFDLPISHLSSCIAEARQCVDLALVQRTRDNTADTSVDPDNFAILKGGHHQAKKEALLQELEKKITEVTLESEVGFTRPGHYIYEFLAEMKITQDTINMLLDTIDHALNLLEDEENLGAVRIKSNSTTHRLNGLKDALRIIFRGTDTSHAAWYRVHIHDLQSRDKEKGPKKGARNSRILSWWCFNPGIAMEEFSNMGVRSIILTSGTLAPLDSFALELRLPFDVRLENPHVIGPDQIWVGVVCCGPSGRSLNSSYKSRDSLEYKLELGNTIVNFARIVPDGLLVFFPSYYVLNQCIESWQTLNRTASTNAATIWERICKHKQPVIEPKESALFNHANEDFMAKLNDATSSGAIFFAVCRGKVSEGLDFADKAGRAVVVTGIPYAMKNDPKVQLKREYLDEQVRSQQRNSKVLRGEEWYVQQASRAVNQAVGRVIRHRNDYGAIILCDERFAQGNAQSQMSLWLRPHIQCYSKFGDAAFTLTRFFRSKGSLAPKKSVASISTSGKPLEFVSDRIQEASPKVSRAQFKGVVSIDKSTTNGVGLFDKKTTTVWGFQPEDTVRPDNQKQPSLSGMLAASRKKNTNQDLSSVLITAANRAIGSADGVARAASAVLKEISASEAQVLGQISCNQPTEMETVDIASISPSGETSKFNKSQHALTLNSSSNKNTTVKSHNNTLPQQLNKASYFPSGSKQELEAPNTRVLPNKGVYPKVLAECHTKQGIIGTKVGNQTSYQADKKTQNAADFLKEVKAHLSIPEYKGFLECMRGLKLQTMNMSSLLENVASLFSAPERIFLLRRFGEFVPSQHRAVYEKVLAEKSEAVQSLAARSLPGDDGHPDSQGWKSHGITLTGFPSKTRKRPATAELPLSKDN